MTGNIGPSVAITGSISGSTLGMATTSSSSVGSDTGSIMTPTSSIASGATASAITTVVSVDNTVSAETETQLISSDAASKTIHTYFVAPSAYVSSAYAQYQEQFRLTTTTTLHRTHTITASSSMSTETTVVDAKNQVIDHAVVPQTTAAPTTTNALSVLKSALPSDVVASIDSQYGLTSTSATQKSSTSTISSSSSSSINTSSGLSSSASTSQTTLSSVTRTSSSHSLSPTSSADAASGLISAPPATNAQHLQSSAVAGVATGVAAGAVLIILALVYFLRRRQQRNAYIAANGGKPGTYPEVAWLYDPARTPPTGSLHGGGDQSRAALLSSAAAAGSAAPLLASNAHDARHDGRREMEEAENGAGSPQLRPIDPTSPLLPIPLQYGRHSDESADEDARLNLQPTASNLTVPSPAVSPRPARDSWAQNKDAWLSSPLLAASSESRSRDSSPQRPASSGRPYVSPPLSSGTFAFGSNVALTPSYSIDEQRRPLTAIFEETRGQ